MFDALVILGTLALGVWVVPKLLWKSYGQWFETQIAAAAAFLRSLNPFTSRGGGRFDGAPRLSLPRPANGGEPANERTNEPRPTATRTRLHAAADALQLDRTRAGLIRVCVAAGLNVSEIRGLLKGTAADIGEEVRAAKAALDREVAPLPADDPAAWDAPAPGRLVRR